MSDPITTLPWKIRENKCGQQWIEGNNGESVIVADKAELLGPDADYIIRCCNSHPKLVEALRLVKRDVGHGGPTSDYVSAYTMTMVKAALAEAEK